MLAMTQRQYPALVLNADFRPLSYFPLSLWSWQDAVKAVLLDRVSVVNQYDVDIHSPSVTLKLPSVIALKDYVKAQQHPPFTRFNLFLRDRFTCQYCATRFRSEDLTFDHVVPRSRGGLTNWENVVAACETCNLKKGNQLPHECGMIPIRPPHQPNTQSLHMSGRLFPPNHLHHTWVDYLYWDSELEGDMHAANTSITPDDTAELVRKMLLAN